MAALVASPHNPILHAFYLRLRAAGKPAKLALTATMRKLLIVLNSARAFRSRCLLRRKTRITPCTLRNRAVSPDMTNPFPEILLFRKVAES